MKVTKVTYQKAYIIGPYLQEKVGFEADVDTNDFGLSEETPQMALSSLRKMADDWHKENNPYINKEQDDLLTDQILNDPYLHPPKQVPVIDKRFEQFEIDIDNSKSQEELEAFIRQYDPFPGKYLPLINKKRQELKQQTKDT